MKLDTIARWQAGLLIVTVFVAGIMLGRWSVKHEWFYSIAMFGYIFVIALLSHATHRSLKKDEAEFREAMKRLMPPEERR